MCLCRTEEACIRCCPPLQHFAFKQADVISLPMQDSPTRWVPVTNISRERRTCLAYTRATYSSSTPLRTSISGNSSSHGHSLPRGRLYTRVHLHAALPMRNTPIYNLCSATLLNIAAYYPRARERLFSRLGHHYYYYHHHHQHHRAASEIIFLVSDYRAKARGRREPRAVNRSWLYV